MKNGRIILGAAAALVTIASSFAFRAHKFTARRAWGITKTNLALCKPCKSVYLTGSGNNAANKCHTVTNVKETLVGPAASKMFKYNTCVISRITTKSL